MVLLSDDLSSTKSSKLLFVRKCWKSENPLNVYIKKGIHKNTITTFIHLEWEKGVYLSKKMYLKSVKNMTINAKFL